MMKHVSPSHPRLDCEGTLESSPPPTSKAVLISPTRRRNRKMCNQCRHDKQKCDPESAPRDWSKNEKCERCLLMGYDCGPPEKAPRRIRQRRLTSISGTPEIHHNPRLAQDHRPRPVVGFGTELAGHLVPYPTVASNRPRWPHSPQASAEQECHKLLKKLEDQHATRILLRWDLARCMQAEVWTGQCFTGIQAALQAAISSVEAQFQDTLGQVGSSGPQELDPNQEELFLSRLDAIIYKFQKSSEALQRLSGADRLVEYSTFIRGKLQRLRRRSNIFSAASEICEGIFDLPAALHRSGVTLCDNTDESNLYETAAEEIGEVMSNLILEDADYRKMLSDPRESSRSTTSSIKPYSAGHLIARRQISQISLRLWTTLALSAPIDCVWKTPLHDIAYAGRMTELRHILEHYGSSTMPCVRDIFGLTPILIAACKDDISAFQILRKHSCEGDYFAQDHNGRSALDLAARNGSEKVVKYILSCRLIPPSFKISLCEAIQAGHNNIVEMFIQYYQDQPYQADTSVQIAAGIAAAKEKGAFEIASQLAAIRAHPPPQAYAINQLDALEYQTYTQELIELETVADSYMLLSTTQNTYD